MSLTDKQKQLIKKLQKVIMSNIVNCAENVRQNALKQFNDVKFKVLSEIDLMEMGEASSVGAFFDEKEKTIFINSSLLEKPFFEHLLLHEMFHAYTYNNRKTGFFDIETSQLAKQTQSTKQVVFEVYNQKYEMLNESATEFYATMFSDKKILSYSLFVPIYANLSENCGFDTLSNLYFANNTPKMIEQIKNVFHLKDDYLIKKLFMQMEQCFNLKTGETNNSLLVEMYKTLVDINIQKLNFVNNKKLTGNELIENINLDQIIDTKYISVFDKIQILNRIKLELNDYISDYIYKENLNNFETTKQMVDDFIFDRFVYGKKLNYGNYKEYFNNNLIDVILYLDQNITYKVDRYALNDNLAIIEVLNFMHNETNHIDISHLASKDKKVFLNSVMNNAKHNIGSPENHFCLSDIKKDFQFNQ